MPVVRACAKVLCRTAGPVADVMDPTDPELMMRAEERCWVSNRKGATPNSGFVLALLHCMVQV